VRFLDTNIFMRFLVPEDKTQSRASKSLFAAMAAGDEFATTSESVICEIAYVLGSKAHYDLAPAEIGARLRPIIALRSLTLRNKKTFLRALDLWDLYPTLDFEDVLTVAHMERLRLTELYSHDRDFDKIPGIKRVDPTASFS
jgi:predicted nucleic acid-binding protein